MSKYFNHRLGQVNREDSYDATKQTEKECPSRETECGKESRGKEFFDSQSRQKSSEFLPEQYTRPESVPQRLPRPTSNSRVLSCRLEPSVHRPTVAIRNGNARIQKVQRGTRRDISRQHLVPPGLCQRS